MKGQGSIEIAAPPEKVWSLFVESENLLRWHPYAQRLDFVGEQRSGVGTIFYMVSKMDERLMRTLNEFTEWEENKKLAIHTFLGDMIKRWDMVLTIEATETGSRATVAYEGVLPYWIIGKIMGLFVNRGMKKGTEEILASFKKAAEA